MTYRHNALASENLGWRLENVVMLELLRRTDPAYQGYILLRPTSASREVDFVVAEHGKVAELIQVSLDISNPKTLARELTALAEASARPSLRQTHPSSLCRKPAPKLSTAKV